MITPRPRPLEQTILEVINARWGPLTLANRTSKLAEECGEVCGAQNKIPEGRATLDDLKAELGDCLIVISQHAALLKTDIETLRAERWKTILARDGHMDDRPPLEMEPEFYQEMEPENCVKCKQPTRYWTDYGQTPMCPFCYNGPLKFTPNPTHPAT